MSLICVLCREQPAASSEHIVLKSLGGKWTVPDFICGDCNNGLGKKIDAPLEEALRLFSLMSGALKGNGDPVADLIVTDTNTGDRLPITHGGLHNIKHPYLLKVGLPTGTEVAPMSKYDPDLFSKVIQGRARKHGYRVLEDATVSVEVEPEVEQYIHTAVNLGGVTVFRSVAKMGLAALAAAGADVRQPEYGELVAFVNSGELPRQNWNIDFLGAAAVREAVGSDIGQHVLAILNNGSGWSVVFLAFGIIPYRVAIPPQDSDNGIAHVVDPVDNLHEDRIVPSASLRPMSEVDMGTDSQEVVYGELRKWANEVFPIERDRALMMRRVAQVFEYGERHPEMEVSEFIRMLADAATGSGMRTLMPDPAEVEAALRRGIPTQD